MIEGLAPMIVFVTAILTTGGVLVLRPISKRLGSYLDAVTQAKLRFESPLPADLTTALEALRALKA